MVGIPKDRLSGPSDGRTKRRRWPAPAIILAVILGTPLGTFLWVTAVGNAQWYQLERRLEDLRKEAVERDDARPVLRGDTVPGNAWDDYELALAETRNLTSEQASTLRGTAWRDEQTPEAIRTFLAGHPMIFHHLHRGTSNAAARNPYALKNLRDGIATLYPQSIDNLAAAAACQARLLMEEGRSHEAAQLSLDLCQFARDVGHNSDCITVICSIAVYRVGFNEIRKILLSRALSREQLLVVGRELQILDQSFPKTEHWLRNELVLLGSAYRRGEISIPEKVGAGPPRALSIRETWPYAFSERHLAANAFHRQWNWVHRMAQIEGASWEDTQRVVAQIKREAASSGNVLIKDSWFPGPNLLRLLLTPKARLRLLRTATHYLATGDVVPLDDPFGSKLQHSVQGDSLTVWSVGMDGRNKGIGEIWKGSDSEEELTLKITR